MIKWNGNEVLKLKFKIEGIGYSIWCWCIVCFEYVMDDEIGEY